jgi:hypothetical protein
MHNAANQPRNAPELGVDRGRWQTRTADLSRVKANDTALLSS